MTQPVKDAEAIFLAALERETPEKRAAYVETTCGDDPELLKRVQELLLAHDISQGPFDSPPPGLGENSPNAEVSEQPGMRIGPYKLLQKIGEGGFGVVFLAEQTEPVRRKVALKVLKPGMDSRQIIARFEAERQALALMDHPHIARVFDGGLASSGRPYFVMELVKGVPITDFCDQNQLSPRQRLELFTSVCQAVQHAHQKGIIHRDLKPSNVLVSRHDVTPVVKVIDFGVAKALGQDLTDKTLITGLAQMVGTPLYMSPEQAGMSDLDVDTRSDIYSLGVLLYELLTGTTPFTKERFRRAAEEEIRRIIREEEPPRPSTRLSESREKLPSISAQRQSEPAKLTRLLRGELDWIVMKALEKDRNRRYETPNAFSLDVQRYLTDEPVQASPQSRLYRLSKFLRRNRGPVVASSLLFLALVVGVIGTSIGLFQAKRNAQAATNALEAEKEARQGERLAREQAMAALRSMTDELVQNQMAREAFLTEQQLELLRLIIKQYEGLAAITTNDVESRAVRAEGYTLVGVMREHLGEQKEAEIALAAGVRLWKQLATDHPERPAFVQELARSQNLLGTLFRATGRFGEAEDAFSQAATLYAQQADAFPARPELRQHLAHVRNNLGNLLNGLGRFKEAEKAYSVALAGQKRLTADFPDRTEFRRYLATFHRNLGNFFRTTGRTQEAGAELDQALAIGKQLVTEFPARPELRLELAGAYLNQGVLLRSTSRLKEAEKAYSEARKIYAQLAAEFPVAPEYRHQLALSLNNLARLYASMGRLQDAETAYAEALVLHQRLAADLPTRPTFRLELARLQNNRGSLLQDLGRLKDAEAAHANALTITKQLVTDYPTPPEFRRELANSHNNLGVVFRVTGHLAEAQQTYEAAATIKQQLVADFPTQPDLKQSLAGTLGNLAIVCEQRGDFAAAKQYLEQAQPPIRAALHANPRNPEYRQLYRNNLRTLAGVNARLNDSAGVVKAVHEIRALGWDAPVDTYHAARSLARCIPIADELKSHDENQRQQAARFYADQAMALLREAVAKGWKDDAQTKKDKDLDPLRDRQDFQQLLESITREKP